MEVDWADMPPDVRVWWLEQQERERQREAAAVKQEAERGVYTLVQDPMAPKALTLPDGSVVYPDPVIYDQPQGYEQHLRDVARKLWEAQ